MSTNVNFRTCIQQLQKEEHRLSALNDLKNFLTVLPHGEVICSLREVGLTKIINCLYDRDQVDLTCEVLKICFDKFNVGDVVRNYPSHIMFTLRHEKDCVRRLAIDEIYKTVATDPELLPVPQFIDIFVAVGQLVADTDIGVANKAIFVTSNLVFDAYPKVLEEMKIALEYNNSTKCNAYEVVVNVASKSLRFLNLCHEHGYIEYMLAELRSDDILYQLNILELLSRLAVTPHGINYLVEHGVLQRISELITESKINPLANIVIPGYLKFFGKIAHIYPREILENYPILLDSLLEMLHLGDQSVVPVALDTLGFVGTTIEGKLSLAALGSPYTTAVATVCGLIKNSATDVKIRALYCLASLISVERDKKFVKNNPVDHRVTLMTREWFRVLGDKTDSMEILYGICKNPFPDIRLAAFGLLDAICEYHWGEELVARTPGFVEYLLDRSVDHSKESKEAKYNLIKRLSNSVAFDATTLLRFTKYVEQGPFYKETEMQVVMEEGN